MDLMFISLSVCILLNASSKHMKGEIPPIFSILTNI